MECIEEQKFWRRQISEVLQQIRLQSNAIETKQESQIQKEIMLNLGEKIIKKSLLSNRIFCHIEAGSKNDIPKAS